MSVVNVDDLGRPTDRPDEVSGLETEIGGDGEASESTGRVEGVGSFRLTLLGGSTVRVAWPEAGVTGPDEEAAVDFVVVIGVGPFLTVLSSDPRPSFGEKSRSN